MLILIRTLLARPSTKGLVALSKLKKKIAQNNKPICNIIEIIEDFVTDSNGIFPNISAMFQEVSLLNSTETVEVMKQVSECAVLPDDESYYARVHTLLQLSYESALMSENSSFQTRLSQMQNKNVENISKLTEEHQNRIHNIETTFSERETSKKSVFYGNESINRFKETYNKICQKKHSGDTLYVEMGMNGALEDVHLKKGDLLTLIGFTSHGKSMLLRWLIYRMLIEYGYNCYYLSMEMSEEVLTNMFFILHANNKKIFPNTPYIATKSFQEGTLTDEEADFLFNQAAQDFTHNENYGTLYIEQPEDTMVRLSDVRQYINNVITTTLPVLDVVAIDYLSLLHPVETTRGMVTTADYNIMIKQFKSMALNYVDPSGKKAPFIGITPAQISRAGYSDCMKTDDLHYETSAIWMYSEFEKSSDEIVSILLTDEGRKNDKVKLQVLKNRDGNLNTTPQDIFCSLKNGGYMANIKEASEEEVKDTLRSLDI